MIDIISADYDDVLKSGYYTGFITYKDALDVLYPLMSRFEAQRKLQDPKFYARLKDDLKKGCVMPPITLAFIKDIQEDKCQDIDFVKDFVNKNASDGYILDGLQRMNSLKAVADEGNLLNDKKLYLNVIVAKSQDKLLYRMITLNNGQKPMTPRHQIEILTQALFDFSGLKNIKIISEKEGASSTNSNSFKRASITKAYLSFLTGNVNNENAKIISSEMDKIIVNRIMEKGAPDGQSTFFENLKFVDELCVNEVVKKWFSVENNLIGFFAGIKENKNAIDEIESINFKDLIEVFEESFKIINVSKIKLGQTRRETVKFYIQGIDKYKEYDEEGLKEVIVGAVS